MIIRSNKFNIYFGNKADNIIKPIDCIATAASLISHKKFAPIAQKFNLENLAFLNQVHGNEGQIVNQVIPAFDNNGDYLITSLKNVGIGVMTGDCLPIVIYDQSKEIAAIAHAGWKGSVLRIAQKAILAMQKEYESQVKELQIFFGPSAKVCCYQVSPEFVQNLNDFSFVDSVIYKKAEQYHFDVPQFNALQLQELGVNIRKISFEYNICTICDDRFFSNRRTGTAGRQMNIISLV